MTNAIVQSILHTFEYTLWRWDNEQPELGFPKPVRINKRKYRFEDELDEFDARRAAERDVEVSAA